LRTRLNDDAVQRAQNIASGLLVVHATANFYASIQTPLKVTRPLSAVQGRHGVRATANFFIYCLVGTSFRRGLARLCSRRSARSSTLTTERREELLLSRHHHKPAADHT